MCGRVTVHFSQESVSALLEEPLAAEAAEVLRQPRYNIAPGSGLVAVMEDRDRGGLRRAMVLHWGLVPGWAESPQTGASLINARAETIAVKPAFADAFRYRRCIVPVSGFYEWDRSARPVWPYYFFPVGGSAVLLLAGIWEYWLHPSGSEIFSVALVTTAANAVMAPIHHRMPLVLRGAAVRQWLDHRNTRPAVAAFLPATDSPSPFRGHPVSTAVNRAGIDLPRLIERVDPPERAAQMDLFG